MLLTSTVHHNHLQLSGGIMRGIDDMEVQWGAEGGRAADPPQFIADAARQHGNFGELLRGGPQAAAVRSTLQQPGGVLASTVQHGTPASDYDPSFFPLVHPTSFPYGSGGRPKGMSLKAWASLLMRRCPRERLAHNVYLNLDMFNIIQRQEVRWDLTDGVRCARGHGTLIHAPTCHNYMQHHLNRLAAVCPVVQHNSVQHE